MNKNKQKIFNDIASFLKKKGAISVKVFGSYARDEETENSDIDILVEFKEIPSLFELSSIENELEKKINTKVQILTKEDISPYIKKYIEKDLKVLI